MKDDQVESRGLRNNPIFVVGVAIAIAIMMIMIGFLMYYRSPTRLILEGLQENKRALTQTEVDKTGPISASELGLMSQQIEEKVLKLNDDADYNVVQLTDSSLGL